MHVSANIYFTEKQVYPNLMLGKVFKIIIIKVIPENPDTVAKP